MAAKRIGIIGSVNMDLVVRTDHMPGPGENVFGTDFLTIPGGKGANQAVAIARLGAQAVFIGKVGDGYFCCHVQDGYHGMDRKELAKLFAAAPEVLAELNALKDAQGPSCDKCSLHINLRNKTAENSMLQEAIKDTAWALNAACENIDYTNPESIVRKIKDIIAKAEAAK